MGAGQRESYSQTAKLLHWLTAAIVVWATVSGLVAGNFAGEPLRSWVSSLNVSLTTLLVPVFAFRLWYRATAPKPAPANLSPRAQRSARIGHAALYVMTAIVLASGVLTMKHDIQVFGWFTIPQPLDHVSLNELFGGVHRVSSIALGLLVLGHVAAVVVHHVSGTPVLQRMLWRRAAELDAEMQIDACGHPLFCAGDIGTAHVAAHRYADAGRMVEGYQWLRKWLDGRAGSGCDWVHIQFHMATFELAVGRWPDAYERFLAHILPAAERGEEALTDAPALLWRLQLSAPDPVEMPWDVLRQAAMRHLGTTEDTFIELHNLLALAGAGDLDSIERWLNAVPELGDPVRICLLRRVAMALRAYTRRTYQQAVNVLGSVLPHLALIGGSREQNRLFADIAEYLSMQAARQAATD